MDKLKSLYFVDLYSFLKHTHSYATKQNRNHLWKYLQTQTFKIKSQAKEDQVFGTWLVSMVLFHTHIMDIQNLTWQLFRSYKMRVFQKFMKNAYYEKKLCTDVNVCTKINLCLNPILKNLFEALSYLVLILTIRTDLWATLVYKIGV